MIILLKKDVTSQQFEDIVGMIKQLGYHAHVIEGTERTVIGAVGSGRGKEKLQAMENLPGVEQVVPILKPYKLAGREIQPETTVITINDKVRIGGGPVVVIAGPCSVESESQIVETAEHVKAAGASMLRGGAFKPRTSPYSFQGLEEKGLRFLRKAYEKTGLPIVTEVLNPADIPLIAEYAHVLQIGARNVQNFALLKEMGRVNRPVLLKRGMMTTLEEFLMSAEYIISAGNRNVILCERGIRTFETATRNTLDLSAVPLLHSMTHLPVIVDPSHGTGHWKLVPPMSCAAIAVGADGLMIEVHPHPDHAESDGIQSLIPEKFAAMMNSLERFAEAAGRTIAHSAH